MYIWQFLCSFVYDGDNNSFHIIYTIICLINAREIKDWSFQSPHLSTLLFLAFCWDIIFFAWPNLNIFLCPAVLKAATCRVRVTAETPRRWRRQFRSTMTPSTPCTLPETASPPADSLSVFFFFSLICQSLFFSHYLSVLVVSLLIVTLHFVNLYQSGSWTEGSAAFWFPADSTLRNSLQPAFPIEPPS